jgi:S1-C subfamily serine protease
MRFTVVRIQAIVTEVDWLQPYKQSSDSPFIGSGFVVDTGTDDIVILTNAHVVQDAHALQVQLPAIGQTFFEAFVPLICKKFDLAVLQLKQPHKLREALVQNNGTMNALHVRPSKVSLGLEVAAVGFPLGSSSLKLSRGIISGTEMVDGTICFQTTAAISPGSSGGPLFALGLESGNSTQVEDLHIIGVNFASSVSEGAQNINYVVPAIHVVQVLEEFHRVSTNVSNPATFGSSVDTDSTTVLPSDASTEGALANENQTNLIRSHQPSSVQSEHDPHRRQDARTPENKYPHIQLRIAPIDAISIEASDALYNTSGGCTSGVFVSRILPTSALHFAEPPIPERSFLISVDNVTLDSFGMGRTADFLGDPTSFESLMMLKEKVDDPVSLMVCQQGLQTNHVVSIRWRPEYAVGVHDVEEPRFEERALEFDFFAGVTLMQMTLNHIAELLKDGHAQTLTRWMLPENQHMPRLLITHVEEGTYASRVLSPGMVVQKINEKNVSTLADLRKDFCPEGIAWTLETDHGVFFSVKFKDALSDQVSNAALYPGSHHLLSPAPLRAAKELNLLAADH